MSENVYGDTASMAGRLIAAAQEGTSAWQTLAIKLATVKVASLPLYYMFFEYYVYFDFFEFNRQKHNHRLATQHKNRPKEKNKNKNEQLTLHDATKIQKQKHFNRNVEIQSYK